MKTCTKCNEVKPFSEYYEEKRAPDGKAAMCRGCKAVLRKQWAADNKDRVKEWRRGHHIISKYGISLEQYEALKMSQAGKCAGCGKTEEETGLFHVDHSHACCPADKNGTIVGGACGKCVRGLLCRGCNYTLGHVKDDPAILRRLTSYLESGGYVPNK